jgi:menaquinone-dependent protoporphyrinogen oxidase
MNILLVYAGKTGTTKKCAKIVGEKLENITIVDLTESDVNIANYDLIIIGASIRIGMMHSKVKKFIKNNMDVLKTKKIAFYVCCGTVENTKQYFETNLPKELLDSAIICDSFGGELDINKQKGLDKFIVKMVTKNAGDKKEAKILTKNIDRFVEEINKVK